MISALRMMAYGTASDSVEEYARIYSTSALESLKKFTRDVVNEFGDEYLRSPTAVDMECVLRINAARGFPE